MTEPFTVDTETSVVEGDLTVPADATGVVVFAHGSGSSRHSSRNQAVARTLQDNRFGTLLFDLLSQEEDRAEAAGGRRRFDIGMLRDRLLQALDKLAGTPAVAPARWVCSAPARERPRRWARRPPGRIWCGRWSAGAADRTWRVTRWTTCAARCCSSSVKTTAPCADSTKPQQPGCPVTASWWWFLEPGTSSRKPARWNRLPTRPSAGSTGTSEAAGAPSPCERRDVTPRWPALSERTTPGAVPVHARIRAPDCSFTLWCLEQSGAALRGRVVAADAPFPEANDVICAARTDLAAVAVASAATDSRSTLREVTAAGQRGEQS